MWAAMVGGGPGKTPKTWWFFPWCTSRLRAMIADIANRCKIYIQHAHVGLFLLDRWLNSLSFAGGKGDGCGQQGWGVDQKKPQAPAAGMDAEPKAAETPLQDPALGQRLLPLQGELGIVEEWFGGAGFSCRFEWGCAQSRVMGSMWWWETHLRAAESPKS